MSLVNGVIIYCLGGASELFRPSFAAASVSHDLRWSPLVSDDNVTSSGRLQAAALKRHLLMAAPKPAAYMIDYRKASWRDESPAEIGGRLTSLSPAGRPSVPITPGWPIHWRCQLQLTPLRHRRLPDEGRRLPDRMFRQPVGRSKAAV